MERARSRVSSAAPSRPAQTVKSRTFRQRPAQPKVRPDDFRSGVDAPPISRGEARRFFQLKSDRRGGPSEFNLGAAQHHLQQRRDFLWHPGEGHPEAGLPSQSSAAQGFGIEEGERTVEGVSTPRALSPRRSRKFERFHCVWRGRLEAGDGKPQGANEAAPCRSPAASPGSPRTCAGLEGSSLEWGLRCHGDARPKAGAGWVWGFEQDRVPFSFKNKSGGPLQLAHVIQLLPAGPHLGR